MQNTIVVLCVSVGAEMKQKSSERFNQTPLKFDDGYHIGSFLTLVYSCLNSRFYHPLRTYDFAIYIHFRYLIDNCHNRVV